jgi:exodeoxyribonuclease-5
MKTKVIALNPVEDYSKYTHDLNEDQTVAFMAMVEFVKKKGGREMFLLKGYAGTGKTYTISRFIQYCVDHKDIFLDPKDTYGPYQLNIALTAPTNKAVQVLRESSIPSLKKMVVFKTCHKLLGLKEHITDSGELQYKASFDDPKEIADCHIVIIDEASMVQDDIFFEMKNHNKKVKLIFLGDNAQVPPVKKEDSEPFLNTKKHEFIEHALTTIMRQKEGSDIVELATHIRNNLNDDVQEFIPIYKSDLSVIRAIENQQMIIDHINNKYSSIEAKESASFVKVVAWSNVKVKEYNRYCRQVFMGAHHPEYEKPYAKIMVGDKMITAAPVIKKFDAPYGGKEAIVMTTNQEFDIVKTELGKEEYQYGHKRCMLEFYIATAKFYDADAECMTTQDINILHEDSEYDFNAALVSLRNSAIKADPQTKKFKWKSYYQFLRKFADVDYAYALTVHRSQGSTFKNTIVDMNNIILNKNVRERNRILYTAITRASNHALIIN